MTPSELWAAVLAWTPKFTGLLIVLLILIAADWISGTFQAIKEHTFQWKKIANIIPKWLLAVLGWTILDFLAALPAIKALEIIADGLNTFYFIALATALGASIVAHIEAFSGGIVDLTKVGLPPDAGDTAKK